MKNKIWLFQIPLVLLFTFAFWVTEAGVQGDLQNEFLREKVFPPLRSLSGTFTNMKFRVRGPTEVKNKIVIVAIDNRSVESIGRWPWHRDKIADLIFNLATLNTKAIGLDIVFAEREIRVPEKLQKQLAQMNISTDDPEIETDIALGNALESFSDQLVLGWNNSTLGCQPRYGIWNDKCGRPPVEVPYPPFIIPNAPLYVTDADSMIPFSIANVTMRPGFSFNDTPLITAGAVTTNLVSYNQRAKHVGFFDAYLDPDGYIRRTTLINLLNGRIYPSLALEVARAGLSKPDFSEDAEPNAIKEKPIPEELALKLNNDSELEKIQFKKTGKVIPTSSLGVMEINFRGASDKFKYVSAWELLKPAEEPNRSPASSAPIEMVQVESNGKITFESKKDLFQNAYVFIGLTAAGVFDMRAFPFDSNTPGVEGHANILDNLLSGDMLIYGNKTASYVMFFLMVIGALLFANAVERLESIPALVLSIVVFGGMGFVDIKLLFSDNNINLNTSLLCIELGSIFVFTMAVKYVMEERNKKFIRGAFAKYVAPAIIDSIMKDPSKLTVGGEKKEMTILFSDIRGFTSFSEKMDAKHLAQFLNDYLGIMTDIVFDNEGTLDKYIGDAVMAFWGAPLDQPKHASNACKAAIKMQQALAQHYERYKKDHGVEVAIGIGINSGPVNVGNMGSERIFEYTVIGDHVNLASRLEGLTKHYGVKIVTTRFTFDEIVKGGEELPPHRILDLVKVKGKKTAVELIQVLEKEFSREGLRHFEDARALYSQKKWDEAIEKFTLADKELRSQTDDADGPCQMYIERCMEFKKSPPGEGWDGSYEMHSK